MSVPDISPLAKRLAEENNVDWRRLDGSGPDGRVVERDVLEFLAKVMVGDESIDPTPEPLPDGMEAWPEEDVVAFGLGSSDAEPAKRNDELNLDDLQAELIQASKQPAEPPLMPEFSPAAPQVSADIRSADEDDLLEVDFDHEPVASSKPVAVMDEFSDDAVAVVDEPALLDAAPDELHIDEPFAAGDFGQADEDIYLLDEVVSEVEEGDVEATDFDVVTAFEPEPARAQAMPEQSSVSEDLFLFEGDAALDNEPEEAFDSPAFDAAGKVEDEPDVFAAKTDAEAEGWDSFQPNTTPEPETDDSLSSFEAFVASRATGDAREERPAFTVVESDGTVDDSVADDDLAFQDDHSFSDAVPLERESELAALESEADESDFMPVDIPLADITQDASRVEDATPYVMQQEGIEELPADDLPSAQESQAYEVDERSDSVTEVVHEAFQSEPENIPVEGAPVEESAVPDADLGFASVEETPASDVMPRAVPLVSYGLLLRRHLDLTALTEAQHAVGRELNGDAPVTPAVFLLRAAAKALRSVPLAEASTIGLAVISDEGFGIQSIPHAADMAFASLLKVASEASAAHDQPALVVADLSAYEVDEAVLNVGAPVLTLGRILYDSASGTYRSTLSLSGDVSPAQGATFLGRVAELLDSPVRLAI